jgi:S1-C subfamily serine protease
MKQASLAVWLVAFALSACLTTLPRPEAAVVAEPGYDESLADVFERVQSSVVTVRTVSLGPSPETGGVLGESNVGSGVLVSSDGRILTAAHVVQTADFVTVELSDGSEHRAHVVGSVPAADVALIQLDDPPPPDAVIAELGDSSRVRVGS